MIGKLSSWNFTAKENNLICTLPRQPIFCWNLPWMKMRMNMWDTRHLCSTDLILIASTKMSPSLSAQRSEYLNDLKEIIDMGHSTRLGHDLWRCQWMSGFLTYQPRICKGGFISIVFDAICSTRKCLWPKICFVFAFVWSMNCPSSWKLKLQILYFT